MIEIKTDIEAQQKIKFFEIVKICLDCQNMVVALMLVVLIVVPNEVPSAMNGKTTSLVIFIQG